MSPARTGRCSEASSSPDLSQPAMVSAMRLARRTTDGVASAASASGDHGSAAAGASCFSVGQISMRPAWPARSATWRMDADPSPGVRPGSAKTASTAASSGSTERKDRVSGTRRHDAPACSARLPRAAPWAANILGSAPWKL